MSLTRQLRKVGLFFGLFFIPTVQAVENPLLNHTHLLPSPFTLPAGRVMIGSLTGIGITDFFELQTHLLANFYNAYNLQLRASMIDSPTSAASLSIGFSYMNFSSNQHISAWLPGGVVGIEIAPHLAFFFGGNLFLSNLPSTSQSVQTSGFLQGGQIETDLSWAYDVKSNRLGNVVSMGFTYDTTFQFYGFGLSHHWMGFHLGIHYYPNVNENHVQPILSGTATVDL